MPRPHGLIARMHRLALLLIAFLAIGLPALASPAPTDAAAGPKVVIIVGPSGDATDHYRADAQLADAAARRYTPNVVRLVSPDATWPAVRQALQGASLVVYLGHGNGWPSRYRDALFSPTQNGFGLNVVQGGGDDVHQYFGEKYIARDIHLAPNAVVVLNHLCYASGNTEPGLPEGTRDDARRRVDNYAAGFIAAGAGAVIADGHFGPAWYVGAILGGHRSIDAIWRAAPSASVGPVLTYASERSAGYTIRMNPDSASGGYYRSLVMQGELASVDVVSAAVDVGIEPPMPTAASLARSGVTFGAATLGPPTTPVPATATGARAQPGTHLVLPYTVARGGSLPTGIEIGARWIPVGGTTTGSGAGKKEGIEPAAATVGPLAIELDLSAPRHPGRYRLVLTLHDADGLAFDAETQAMLAPVVADVSATGATVVPGPTPAAAAAGPDATSPAGLERRPVDGVPH